MATNKRRTHLKVFLRHLHEKHKDIFYQLATVGDLATIGSEEAAFIASTYAENKTDIPDHITKAATPTISK